jgi:response regulator of citrate/malate metabolism
MKRGKGLDENKIRKILGVLKQNPQGLWIREIARRAMLSTTTTQRYLREFLQDRIEEVVTVKGGLVKFVRLKRK